MRLPGKYFSHVSGCRSMSPPIASRKTRPPDANLQTGSTRISMACPTARAIGSPGLDYYMGRGSLEGWLRTVLSQQYVNRYRSQSKEVSLDEQVEAGVSFADQTPASAP